MKKKFLVLGHPRSATWYAATVLWRAGKFTSHETDQRRMKSLFGTTTELDGVVTGLFTRFEPNFDEYSPILHQVRHPLKVITSCAQKKMSVHGWRSIMNTCREYDRYEARNRRFVSDLMKSWLVFTDMADDLCDYWYRVEDMPQCWSRIRNYLGIAGVEFPRKVATNLNTFKHRRKDLTWQRLSYLEPELTEILREKAISYGYEKDKN